MKKKWQTFLSIILYIIILTYAFDFNIFKLIDLQLIFLTLAGTLILTIPFYQKGITHKELLYVFGRKGIETGFIQTFLLLFARLQNDAGYNRLLGDIALCFRPLLYGFCLFILLAEKSDQTQSAYMENKPNEKTANTSEKAAKNPGNENHPEKFILQDFVTAYGLTKRETEITRLILRGKSNAEIAGELFISETTVKKHVSNIFEKTCINRREELIIKVRDE